MQNQRYDTEGLEQANAFLISSNSAVMEKFSKMSETMNVMKAHIKTLCVATTTRPFL